MKATTVQLGIFLYLGAITAIPDPGEIDAFYYNTMYKEGLNTREDVICNYPTGAVVSVCGEVFERLSNDYPDLHLSYAAYSEYAPQPVCGKNKVRFTTPRFNEPTDILQNMMPCRGQHEPLRTSITIDDYYDEFYISTGTEPHSVMVYKLEKGPYSEFFRPLEHYKSIKTTAETIITSVPLENFHRQALSPPVSRNDNAKEVEIIYVREVLVNKKREKQMWEYILEAATTADENPPRLPNPPENPLQAKDDVRLLYDTCKRLFNCDKYQKLSFTINIGLFYLNKKPPSTLYVEQILAFPELSKYHIKPVFKQGMYPCFGRNMERLNNYDEDEFRMQYQISFGSRPSSIMIYKLKEILNESMEYIYSPVEFVENFNFDDLVSTPISVHEAISWLENQGGRQTEKQETGKKRKKRTSTTEQEGASGSRKKASSSTGRKTQSVSAIMKTSPSNTNENESPSKGDVCLAEKDVPPSNDMPPLNENVTSMTDDITPMNEDVTLLNDDVTPLNEDVPPSNETVPPLEKDAWPDSKKGTCKF